MRKNYLFILFSMIIICTIVQTITDNNSYSKKQRKIFNNILNYAVHERPLNINTIEVISNEKYRKYNKELNLLKEKRAPDWNVKIGTDFNPIHLSGDALTGPELKQNVEELHNADTCLYLATQGNVDYPFDLLYIGKKWLKKAADMGRPGASFLLEMVLEQERRLPEPLPLLNRQHLYDDAPSATVEYLSHLRGYDEFVKLIGLGDFELYKVAQFFEPGIGDSNLAEEMRRALKIKAAKGDRTALRNSAELELRPLSFMNITRTLQNGGIETPDIPLKWRSMYKRALTATSTLKGLANDGDIPSMHLWLKYGLRFEDGYDYKTWRNIFDFTDILLRQGYADVLKVMKIPYLYDSGWFEYFPWGLVKSSYTEASSISTGTRCLEELKKRGDDDVLFREIVTHALKDKLETDDERNDAIRPPRLTDEMAAYLQLYGIQRLLLELPLLHQDDRSNIMDFLNRQAVNGYPEAELALGDIWKRGVTGKSDFKKARSFFEQAWRKCAKYNTNIIVFYKDENEIVKNFPSNTATECMIELMDMYLIKENSLLYEKKAFDLVKEYINIYGANKKYLGASFFLLGQLYEKGIGTDPSKEKALECYLQGINSDDDIYCYTAICELSKKIKLSERATQILKNRKNLDSSTESKTTRRLKTILNTWAENKRRQEK